MTTDAKTIQCSYEAGLILAGQGENGTPEFVGSAQSWRRYGELVRWVEQFGTYPWSSPSKVWTTNQ